MFTVQEKVELLTERLESTGNVENIEKPSEAAAEGTNSGTKTPSGKKTCKKTSMIIIIYKQTIFLLTSICAALV